MVSAIARVGAAALLLVAVAAAGQDSGRNDELNEDSLQVRLEVTPGCAVTEPTGSDYGALYFGEHFLLSEPVDRDITLAFTLECGQGVPARIRIDGGHSGSVGERRMRHIEGGAMVAYQLYLDAARTAVWDDTNGLELVGDGTAQSVVVHGRVPAQPALPAGIYRDTLQVTITF